MDSGQIEGLAKAYVLLVAHLAESGAIHPAWLCRNIRLDAVGAGTPAISRTLEDIAEGIERTLGGANAPTGMGLVG